MKKDTKKIPSHLMGGKSQIDKQKEAKKKATEEQTTEEQTIKKSRIESIANEIIEEEENESKNKSSNNSTDNSTDNSINNPSNNSADNSTVEDLLSAILDSEEEKNIREKANVYLDKITMDKLRTLSEKRNKSITNIVEELLVAVLKNVEVDDEAVNNYIAKNKAKGNKKPSKKKKK